jgi:hypothetical protein
MGTTFVILRRETIGSYSTRGPVAQPASLKEAQSEIVRLKSQFPYQDFVIMGEVGTVKRTDRVTVRIDAPDLSDAPPRKRRLRKPPELPELPPIPVCESRPLRESGNVFPLRKEEFPR